MTEALRVGVLAVVVFAAVACTTEPTVNEVESECVPGRAVACECDDGSVGAEVCDDKGRFMSCTCFEPVDLDAGTGSDSGEHDSGEEDLGQDDSGGQPDAVTRPDVENPSDCVHTLAFARSGDELVKEVSLGVGEEVVFDGSRSAAAPGQEIESYRWTTVPGDAVLSTEESFTYVFDEEWAGAVRLQAFDGQGNPSCASSEVGVEAIGRGDLYVELTWDNDSDLDIRLVPNVGQPVSYQARDVQWGDTTATLEFDDTDGFGPEAITVENIDECGWYTVLAHNFRGQPTNAVVKIFRGGELVYNTGFVVTDGQWYEMAQFHGSGQIFNGSGQPGVGNIGSYNPVAFDELVAADLCGVE